MKIIDRIINWFKKMPDRQKYLDFLKSFLYVPLILILIVANLYNIWGKKQENKKEASPSPSAEISKFSPKETNSQPLPQETNSSAPTIIQFSTPSPQEPSPSPKKECQKEAQPVEIIFPKEGQKIAGIEPVCVVFNLLGAGFCEQTINYRVNAGNWTPTDEESACFYNLPEGEINFELKIKNEESGKEEIYKRSFSYQKETSQSPTSSPSPTASPS